MNTFSIHIITLFSVFISLLVKWWLTHTDWIEGVGAQNLEATYHVLWTIRALMSSSVINHFMLPTVTGGLPEDKFIPWGATLPTHTGDYIYTSFTSPTFLLPTIIIAVFDLPSTIKTLSVLNFIIGSISTALLYLTSFLVLGFINVTGFSRYYISAFSILISIFSREELQSHGLIYWAHSLYQPFFILTILSYMYLHYALDNFPSRLFLFASVALGAFVEWTGYLTGVGIAITIFFFERGQRRIQHIFYVIFSLVFFLFSHSVI